MASPRINRALFIHCLVFLIRSPLNSAQARWRTGLFSGQPRAAWSVRRGRHLQRRGVGGDRLLRLHAPQSPGLRQPLPGGPELGDEGCAAAIGRGRRLPGPVRRPDHPNQAVLRGLSLRLSWCGELRGIRAAIMRPAGRDTKNWPRQRRRQSCHCRHCLESGLGALAMFVRAIAMPGGPTKKRKRA